MSVTLFAEPTDLRKTTTFLLALRAQTVFALKQDPHLYF